MTRKRNPLPRRREENPCLQRTTVESYMPPTCKRRTHCKRVVVWQVTVTNRFFCASSVFVMPVDLPCVLGAVTFLFHLNVAAPNHHVFHVQLLLINRLGYS